MVPTGIPSWKGWLSMLLMPWGPPLNGEVRLQCRSTGGAQCLRNRVSTGSIALFCHPFLGWPGSALSREGSGSCCIKSSHGGGRKPSRVKELAQLSTAWMLGAGLTILLVMSEPSSDCQPNWPNVQHLASMRVDLKPRPPDDSGREAAAVAR